MIHVRHTVQQLHNTDPPDCTTSSSAGTRYQQPLQAHQQPLHATSTPAAATSTPAAATSTPAAYLLEPLLSLHNLCCQGLLLLLVLGLEHGRVLVEGRALCDDLHTKLGLLHGADLCMHAEPADTQAVEGKVQSHTGAGIQANLSGLHLPLLGGPREPSPGLHSYLLHTSFIPLSRRAHQTQEQSCLCHKPGHSS